MLRLWVISSCLLVLIGVGCSRVPPGRNAPALRVASKKAKKSAKDKKAEKSKASDEKSAKKTEDSMFKFEGLEGDLETLCARACEHWMDLRYPNTPPTEALKGESRAYLQNVVVRSHANQQVKCESQCIQNQDHERIRCILLTSRLERLSRCLE